MHTIKNFFVVLVLFNLFIVQSCKKEEPPKPTFVSGQLPDYNDAAVKLVRVSDYFPGLKTNKTVAETMTDAQGNFLFPIKDLTPDYYQIVVGKFPRSPYDFFVNHGDSIHIKKDAYDTEDQKITITGLGAENLQHLTKDYEVFPIDKLLRKIKRGKFETALTFKSFLDSIQTLRLQTLEANTQLNKEIKADFKNDILVQHAELLLSHLERRNYTMNQEFTYHFPSDEYMKFLDKIDLKHQNIESTHYKSFAGTYLQHKTRIALQDLKELWYKQQLAWKFNYIESLDKTEWTDILALSTVKNYSMDLMEKDFFEEFTDFQKSFTFKQEKNKKLYAMNSKDYLRLEPGEKAPNFQLEDAQGNPVKLSDYKGKVVYIDFWGTWCSPCIQEIPEAMKLQEKYKDDPVVFLYVALEYDQENVDNWKNFIQGKDERFQKYLDKPFPGVHVVARKQFNNKEIAPYKLNFAPTYVLIDQQGTIVDARADRPKEISVEIDKLLNKEIEQ
ncbi:MAG: TlpA disulfide reductase family protein [Bacteroidota bacterium]